MCDHMYVSTMLGVGRLQRHESNSLHFVYTAITCYGGAAKHTIETVTLIAASYFILTLLMVVDLSSSM